MNAGEMRNVRSNAHGTQTGYDDEVNDSASGKVSEEHAPIPVWWNSSEEWMQEYVRNNVKRGHVEMLARSPGGNAIPLIRYGEAQPSYRGTANWSSALGSGDPSAYWKRGKHSGRKPLLMLLAGIHGQELEGMVAALSLVTLMETGKDLRGKEFPDLAGRLRQLHLLIVPIANPDGRKRVPQEGWVGLPLEQMTRYGQGTDRCGNAFGWKPSKRIHPMQGDVGLLGGYFDDNGINMMHDDWASPMSATTKALLRLVSNEGPDLLLNLHSHGFKPEVLDTACIGDSCRKDIRHFARIFYDKLDAARIPHGRVPDKQEDREDGIPDALNLQGMFHHVGAAGGILYESPHGVVNPLIEEIFSYDVILDAHHLLFETAAQILLDGNIAE